MGNFDLYHYAPGKQFQPDRGPANQVRAAPDNVVRTLPNAEVRELGFRRELERTPSRYSAISVAVPTNRACRGGFGFVVPALEPPLPVTMTVRDRPSLIARPTALSFSYQPGSTLPTAQTLAISGG